MDISFFFSIAVTVVVAVLWLFVAMEAAKRAQWRWLIVMLLLGPLGALLYWISNRQRPPGEDSLPLRRSETGELPDRDYRR